jgi:DnaJ-class molecular chaperone
MIRIRHRFCLSCGASITCWACRGSGETTTRTETSRFFKKRWFPSDELDAALRTPCPSCQGSGKTEHWCRRKNSELGQPAARR